MKNTCRGKMNLYCKLLNGEIKKIKRIKVDEKTFTPDDIREISEDGTTITLKDGTVYKIGIDLFDEFPIRSVK